MSQSTATDTVLPQPADILPPQPKRSKILPILPPASVNNTYYIVCINFPCVTASVDMESLKTEAKGFNIDLQGDFMVHSNEHHIDGTASRIYLLEFSKSLQASRAKAADFLYTTVEVDTSEILQHDAMETRLCIDLELTTVSAASAATSAAVSAAVSNMCKVMLDMMRRSDYQDIKAFVEKVHTGEVSVPAPVEPIPAPPSLCNIPEVMYNELFFSQVKEAATDMGFTVTTNKSNFSGFISRASRYSSSKPDLVIYHGKELLAYVVHAPGKEPDSEEEPDVTLSAGMIENKLDEQQQHLGQLLAGMEKVAGDIAFLYLNHRHTPIKKKIFKFIQIYGLLVNHTSRSCKVYKLVMDFEKGQSLLYVGQQELTPSVAMSRLLATMKERTKR